MKNFRWISLAIGFLLLSFYSTAWSQSITINSVSATHFCVGDPISITFTVSGTWGHNNAFTFQLSDQTGSFANNNFTNLGSVLDTAAGQFTIHSSIPPTAPLEGMHFRVRIIGAYPYTISSDNGSDIIIGAPPNQFYWQDARYKDSTRLWVTGISHQFKIIDEGQLNGGNFAADTVLVDFGEGASPATLKFTGPESVPDAEDPSTLSTTYSTTGIKTVTITTITLGGCSVSTSMQMDIRDCTTPTIPNDAIIISQNGQTSSHGKTYWVNPGITFSPSGDDTIFAESGATITGNFSNLVYLKPGASTNMNLFGVVFYAPGASVDNSDPNDAATVECDSLTYDYTVAPPNSVMHINTNEAVMPPVPVTEISVSPNPTNGMVAIDNVPLFANVTVANILGQTVEQLKPNARSTNTLDLSKEPSGTYYIRVASGANVVTKKVVKE